MGYTSSTLQSDIDSYGYALFQAGTHTLTTKVVLDGSDRVKIEARPGANISWTGSSSASPFQYEQDAANPKRIHFKDLAITSSVDGSPIFKTASITDTCNYLLMENCDFSVVGAYAVDINLSPYIVTPVFRYMQSSGGGALRLRARSGGADPYHATSQMEVTGWVHNGSARVGPAFNLRGCSGLRMTDIYDEGDPSLHADLQGVYEGPVSLRINSPRTPAYITNWRCNYSSDFTNAANCYLHELRTDSGTGNGRHEYIRWINGTVRDANISGVAPFRIMGGETTSEHGLVVDLVDCEDLATTDFDFGGKLWVRVLRDWVNPGNESTASSMDTLINTTYWYSGSMSDTIYTDTDRIPSGSNDGGASYTTGLSLYDDWVAASSEFEDLL